MTFEVIPAIDVAGGRLVRFTPEGPVPVDAFGGDPVTAAESFLHAGARWLHLVDMDLAFTGTALNVETMMAIRRVALFAGAKVEASGGVVAQEDLDHLLDVGADRVILGSGALVDPSRVARLVAELGDRIAVGVEIEDGRIRARGRAPVDLPLAETLDWLAEVDTSRLLVTAVRRVGAMSGPDLEAVAQVVALGRPVIAAGGIATLEDVGALRGVGAAGVVVGRAALEGGLDLAEALERGGA